MKILICHAVAMMALMCINVNMALACGACSSNLSSYNSGFTQYAESHSISFTGNIRYAKIHMPPYYVQEHNNVAHNGQGHSHLPAPRPVDYEERVFSYEWLIEFYPVRNLSLSAVIPLIQRQLFEDGIRMENKIGLGDMLFSGQYHVINKLNADSARNGHRFSLGTGIQLPSGLYEMIGYDGIMEPGRQPGTGSFNFLFNTQYLFLVKKWGLSGVAFYKVNTKNKNGFKFGNQFNSSLTTFYNKQFRNFGVVPSAGLNLDIAGENKIRDEEYLIDSGSKLLSALFGIDLYYKGMGLNFTYFLPAYESLNGLQFETGHRFSATVRYVFQKTNDRRIKEQL